MTALIIVLFVLSGFAGLTYELVWTKHLMLIFGVSHAAISTVLAAFMAGLAIGSVVLGRAADRVRNPLGMYALLEVGIAASAAALPFALSMVDDAYVSMARSMPAHSWVFAATRFAMCFALLLVPTTLMGGTLPAISRHLIRRSENLGLGVGVLYGANTVGGILGAGATGFVLLAAIGAQRTTLLAVGLNLTAALVAGLMSWRATPAGPGTAAASEEPEAAERRGGAWLPAFVLVAFALAGATSLAYQVLWTRVLIYLMDLTIYSFTTILVTFLTGLALGSFVFARVADRARNLLGLFGVMHLVIAVSAMYMLHTLGKMPTALLRIGAMLSSDPQTIVLIGRFAAAGMFLLLPTILMGGTFPVITRLYTRDLRRLGRSLGDLYGANTVGCVVGSLVAGFVLLRLVGAQQAIGLVALVSWALGAASLAVSAARRSVWVVAGAGVVLAAGMLLAHGMPPAVMLSERVRGGGFRLLYYKEGPEASLAVLQNIFGSREININGLSTAYSDYGDILSHKLLAHPPALMAEDPKSVLIIGLGMGSTAWSFAQYPVERIDCVELVPAERETAEMFLPENGGVLADPRFNLIIGDGRNYLLTTPQQYDIISFNAIHPAYSPYLYTREFYELCRSRLTETGIICAWLPTNSRYFPSLLRTFQEVFPHCSLWVANIGHLSLIGTPGPQSFDLADLVARTAAPGVRRNLAETHLEEPRSLLSRCVMDAETVRWYWEEQGARLNTDDLPHVEFDRSTDSVRSCLKTMRSLMPHFESVSDRLANLGVPQEEEAARRREVKVEAEAFRLTMEAGMASAERRVAEACVLLEEAGEIAPENRHSRFMRAVILSELRTDTAYNWDDRQQQLRAAVIAEVIAEEEERAARGPGLPERYLTTLRLGLARILTQMGEREAAVRYVDDVLAADETTPLAQQMKLELHKGDYGAGR